MRIHFFNTNKHSIPIIITGLGIFFAAMFESILGFCVICTGGLFIHTRLKNKHVIGKLSLLIDENKKRAKQINFIQNFLFSYVMNVPNISSTTHIHHIIQEILRMKESYLRSKKMVFLFHQTSLTTSFIANNSCWCIFIHEMLDIFIQEYPPQTTITYQLISPSSQKKLPFFNSFSQTIYLYHHSLLTRYQNKT